MIVLYILGFFALAFVLTKAADLTLDSIKSISRQTGTKAFVISALVLSLATSLPELFVGITSAIEGRGSLSFGNVLGANVTNILLVVGLSTAVVGGVVIHGEKIIREFLLAVGAGILPLILLLDGSISRLDGVILLIIYLAYSLSFFKRGFLEIGSKHLSGNTFVRFIKSAEQTQKKTDKSVGHLLVGIAALLFISDLIVQLSVSIASTLSIPVFVVGLLLVSLGTTLPELIVSMRSLKTHADGIFLGNILGSLIINSTLIVGVVSIIDPIVISDQTKYLIPGGIFIAAIIFFWLLAKTKHFLSRAEALFLLFLYIVFIVIEFV